jgi:hypothetical protein
MDSETGTPEFVMDNDDFIPQLVRLLAPLLTTEAERRAMLIEAFSMTSPILSTVDFDGAPQPFLLIMIAALHTFGDVVPNKPALSVLRDTAKNHVGADVALQIEALKPQIEVVASRPIPNKQWAERKIRRITPTLIVVVLLAPTAVAGDDSLNPN